MRHLGVANKMHEEMWGARKRAHVLRAVTYVLLLEVELTWGSNVQYDVCSKAGVH